MWAERLSDLFARCALSVDPRGRLLNLFGAAKSAGAREKNPRSQKSPTGKREKNISWKKTPTACSSPKHTFRLRYFLGKNTSDARGRNFFWLRVLSVCSYMTRQFEAITRHVFSRMLGVIWRKRQKEPSLRRAPQAGRTPSNALTHQTPWRKRPRPSPSRPRLTSSCR